MRKSIHIELGALALASILGACNHSEKVTSPTPLGDSQSQTNPAAVAQMNQEITVLKQRNLSPDQMDHALREVLKHYGYQVPAPESLGSLPQPLPEEETEDLKKSAANSGYLFARWKTAKSFNFSHPLTYENTFTVAHNSGFSFWTEAVAPADPVVVAYYQTSGDGNSSAYTTQIVAFNDDQEPGNPNSRIEWTNTTGSSKSVKILVFAYAPSLVGSAGLKYRVPSGYIRNLGNQPLYAVPVIYNTQNGPYPGCTGPSKTKITLSRVLGGGFQSGVLAVNNGTQRGGFIRESSANSESLTLTDVLPSGSWNFVVGVMLDIDELAYEESIFNITQQDMYSCSQ